VMTLAWKETDTDTVGSCSGVSALSSMARV
jgi:hypothetical protein